MLPEKPIWWEGQNVSPVHFQQMDRYFDSEIQGRSGVLTAHAWGLTEYVIDEQHLNLGKVVLRRAKGILPDGTLFEVGNESDPLSLDIEPGMTGKRVMLVLPMRIQGGSEARDAFATGLATRYIRKMTPVRDYNVYGKKESKHKEIDLGQLDLQLMFEEGTDLKNFISMPIAQIVECRQDKTVVLDKNFLPTFLHVKASAVLSGYLDEIIGLLSHRGDHLAARASAGNQTGTAEMGNFLLLQCINKTEPVFRHLEQTTATHPASFYAHLLSLVGELATFAEPGKRPQNLLPYDHGAQHVTFAALMQQARFALSMVLEQHAVLLPIQQRRDNISLVPVHDKNLLSSGFFVLVVQADMDQKKVIEQIPRQLKIGTPENIKNLVHSQLPGIALRSLPVAPRQIPFHAGKSYFRLDISTKERSQFELSTGFAMHTAGVFPGLQLEVWAIKE